jgi:hypothetical protein
MNWWPFQIGRLWRTWTTEVALNWNRIKPKLNALLSQEPPSIERKPRILELLIQLEYAAPAGISSDSTGTLSSRRALALQQMGKPGLALLEIKDARSRQPNDPAIEYVYLDISRQAQSSTSVRESPASDARPDAGTSVGPYFGELRSLESHDQDTSEDVRHARNAILRRSISMAGAA